MATDPDPTLGPVYECGYTFPLTERDLETIDLMQRATGCTTPECVFRLAMYHYALHLQIGDVHADFMRRQGPRKRPSSLSGTAG